MNTMSREGIPIRFTPKQQDLIKKFLGRTANQVLLSPEVCKVMKYGIMFTGRAKVNIIPLTDEQQKQLKRDLNCSCEYLELTKDMTYK